MYDDISFDIGGKKKDKLLSRIAALEAERDRLRETIKNAMRLLDCDFVEEAYAALAADGEKHE